MSQETVDEKFFSMIDVFRNEFENLTPREKEKVQMINSLKEPCQIHIISSSENDRHLLVKTHFKILKDKTIQIFHLKTDTLVQQLEEFLEEQMWKNQKDDLDMRFRKTSNNQPTQLRNVIVRFGKEIMNSRDLIRRSSLVPHIGSMSLINSQIAVWDAFGNLNEIDLKKEAKKFVNGYKEDLRREEEEKIKKKTKQITQSVPNTTSGYGTYFYPFLLIDEFNPSISDEINGKEGILLNGNVLHTKFDNIPLSISKGGLVGLETDDNEVAEKILNTIMATALLLGLASHALGPSEIAKLTFDKDAHQMHGSSWSASTMRMRLFDSREMFGLQHEVIMRKQIILKDLELIIQKAEKIWGDKKCVQLLRSLLGSFTYFSSGYYSQSFITSWTIIEKNLYDLWDKKLAAADITKRVQENLDHWDLWRVIEILHIDKEISEDEYLELKELQRLRNDVVHEGYEIPPKQVENCFILAEKIVRNETKIEEKISTKSDIFV